MFITLNDAKNLTEKEIDDIYNKHFNDALYTLFKLSNLDIYFTKAKGMYLWDKEGNKYLDFIAGFGSLNLGHNPDKVINSLKKHFNCPNLIEQSINKFSAILANNISYITNDELPRCHFTNSGTETVEEAIKLAMMKNKKGKILYCENAYHGKTLGSISALGDKLKENYSYFNNFIEIPFGDFEALKKAIKKHKISAFLVEPIQGEGGFVIPPNDYFFNVRKLCDNNNILLILDEIQTGLGRCGTMFFYEQLGIVPDILCISKSLSGGIIPIGCICIREELWKSTYGKLKNGALLSTTFGGNTFACISAIETLTIIKEQNLQDKAKELGEYTLVKLNKLKQKHKLITEIRGIGLFIGIEFGSLKKYPSKTIIEFIVSTIISKMLREHKIICGVAANNPSVLRFEPPLIVSKEEIDNFIESLEDVLNDEDGELSLAMDSIKNLSKGIIKNIIDK